MANDFFRLTPEDGKSGGSLKVELSLSSALGFIAGLLVCEILLQRTFAVNVTGRVRILIRVLDTSGQKAKICFWEEKFLASLSSRSDLTLNPKTVSLNFRVLQRARKWTESLYFQY